MATNPRDSDLLEAAIVGFPGIVRLLAAISAESKWADQGAEESEIMQAAVAGLPRVAKELALLPFERREQAFKAVERGYLENMRDSGLSEETCKRWTAALMRQLRTKVLSKRIVAELEMELHALVGVQECG